MTVAWPVPADSAAPSASGPRSRLWIVVAAQLVAGVLAGVIWRLWAPATLGFVLSSGTNQTVVIPDESESQIAADGRFFVLTVLLATIAGIGAWQVRRARGVAGLLAITAGALASGLVTWGVGRILATGHSTGAVNSTIRLPLQLHATALLAAPPLAAALVYVVLAGLSSHTELTGDSVLTGGSVGRGAEVETGRTDRDGV